MHRNVFFEEKPATIQGRAGSSPIGSTPPRDKEKKGLVTQPDKTVHIQ